MAFLKKVNEVQKVSEIRKSNYRENVDDFPKQMFIEIMIHDQIFNCLISITIK